MSQHYSDPSRGDDDTATEDIAIQLKADTHNRTIEQAELARWATCPDKALAYYTFPAEELIKGIQSPRTTGAKVTTWPGTVLGYITSARVYRSNFGGRIVSMRVAGTNGATYHGRASWDNGTCIVLRRSRKGRTA